MGTVPVYRDQSQYMGTVPVSDVGLECDFDPSLQPAGSVPEKLLRTKSPTDHVSYRSLNGEAQQIELQIVRWLILGVSLEFGSLAEGTEMKRFGGATAELFSLRRTGELSSCTWLVSVLTWTPGIPLRVKAGVHLSFTKSYFNRIKCVYLWFIAVEFSIDLT